MPEIAALTPLEPAWIALAQALPVIVWTALPDGEPEFVSRRWAELTGRSTLPASELDWFSFVDPRDAGRVSATFTAALQTGTALSVEFRLRRPNGSFQWARSQAEPQRDAQGRIIRWLGVLLDLDEGRHADDHIRVVAASMPVIAWTADASGWIDWYNARWYDYTGLSTEESVGWGWQVAHHRDDFLEVMRKWPHSIATGEPFEMEFRLRAAGGNFHWFLARVEPYRDESGTVLRWYGSCVNIDAQKVALSRTMRIAETLQDFFLPKTLPQFPDLRLDAVYLPAEKDAHVGGDWFDAVELPDGTLFVSIGDVAGHGIEASITVGRLRQAIYTLTWGERDPSVILKQVDRILSFQEPETMATAIVGRLDPAHKTLTYAIAGHPPPMLARQKHRLAELLPYGQPPLGVGHEGDRSVFTVDIERDSVLVFYTDGMTEFTRDLDAMERKLRAAVSLFVGDATIERPAKAIVDLIFEEAPAIDDAALLLLQFSNVEGGRTEQGLSLRDLVWRFHSSSALAVHASRREIMAHLRRIAAETDRLFDVELIVGEIFANTVRHAPGLVEVRIEARRDGLVLTVRDSGPGVSSVSGDLPDDILSEHGRGMYLINALARDLTLKSRPGYGMELSVLLPVKAALGELQADNSE